MLNLTVDPSSVPYIVSDKVNIYKQIVEKSDFVHFVHSLFFIFFCDFSYFFFCIKIALTVLTANSLRIGMALTKVYIVYEVEKYVA